MFVTRDNESDGCYWFDRGLDGRADHFAPCPTCRELLGAAHDWKPASLCPDCGSRLEIESAVAAIKGERPLICLTDPSHRTLDGSPIPMWGALPDDRIQPDARYPQDPGWLERIP